METFWLNFFGVLAIAGLIAFFAKEGWRKFAFFGSLWALVACTIIGWVVFVIAHFISKAW